MFYGVCVCVCVCERERERERESEWVSEHFQSSGNHNIVSSGPYGLLEFVRVQKSLSYQKRKLLMHGTLKNVNQVYHLKQEK